MSRGNVARHGRAERCTALLSGHIVHFFRSKSQRAIAVHSFFETFSSVPKTESRIISHFGCSPDSF